MAQPVGSPRNDETGTPQLVAEIAGKAVELVSKEIDLAKAEFKADVQAEVATAKGLGVAGVCAICMLNLLLVAGVLALASVLPGWLAALAVAAAVLLVGVVVGLVGWAKRVKRPLGATRDSLKENVQWTKERLA